MWDYLFGAKANEPSNDEPLEVDAGSTDNILDHGAPVDSHQTKSRLMRRHSTGDALRVILQLVWGPIDCSLCYRRPGDMSCKLNQAMTVKLAAFTIRNKSTDTGCAV